MSHFGHTYLPTQIRCFLYYAYYLSPIFAEIPTYPKIGRPLWTFPNEQKKVDTRMHIARNTGTLILISHIQMLNTSGLFKRLKVVNS